jgi:hypothetical protein
MTLSTTSMTCCFPIWPNRLKRCLFSTRLPLMTHQIYSGQIQTDLKRPHDLNPSPTWRRIWICCSRSRTQAPSLAGRPPFSTSTQVSMKSTPRAVPHFQAGSEKDSVMRESPLVGRPPPLKTTRNPTATLNLFWVASWFNHHFNTTRTLHVLEGL